jgi:hypothetical protein
MRRLIYIPIIHTDFDMGSLASALELGTTAVCGEKRWERHKATASRFWQIVSDFFETLDAKGLKVYQDGFASDGVSSKKMVREAVRRGSKNYKIILGLLSRGAEIVSTEDKALLQEEYGYISRIIDSETLPQRVLAYKEYNLRKNQLMIARDSFIARRINETLADGEVGALFMGAYHDIVPHLARDIAVRQLKEREKVKAYFDELMYGRDERNLERLTRYINSAVGALVIIN